MALFIPGKTQCSICQLPVDTGDARQFPPFVPNELDELYLFHDAVVHASCFSRHPLSPEVEERLTELRTLRKECAVCFQPIDHPDEFFTLGHLVADRQHPLYRYNYLCFHKHHLIEWEALDLVYTQLVELKASGKVRGQAYDILILYLDVDRHLK